MDDADAAPGSASAPAAGAAPAGSSAFWEGIQDEYDPARPNDYETVRKERERQRLEAEAEAERQERLREVRELEALEARRDEEERRAREAAGGGFTPSQHVQQGDAEAARRAALSLSGEEAFRRRAGLSAVQPGPGSTPALDAFVPGGGVGLGSILSASAAAPPAPTGQPKGMGLAQKMLEKMGWREGEGLGRNRQGMAAPLAVEKTDVRSGRVGEHAVDMRFISLFVVCVFERASEGDCRGDDYCSRSMAHSCLGLLCSCSRGAGGSRCATWARPTAADGLGAAVSCRGTAECGTTRGRG